MSACRGVGGPRSLIGIWSFTYWMQLSAYVIHSLVLSSNVWLVIVTVNWIRNVGSTSRPEDKVYNSFKFQACSTMRSGECRLSVLKFVFVITANRLRFLLRSRLACEIDLNIWLCRSNFLSFLFCPFPSRSIYLAYCRVLRFPFFGRPTFLQSFLRFCRSFSWLVSVWQAYTLKKVWSML